MREIWPNFFIVGAAKGGTTSLYAYLKQHPQVFLPKVKEPQFFAHVCPSPEQRYLVEAITDQRAYLRLFRNARGFPAIGDASPSYLWHPEVPWRIRKVVPEAKIIITLRDPVERAFSHYLADFREGAQSLPFYEALCQDMARREKGVGISYLYVELGQYARQVRRYLDVFGPERVHVLLFEDLKRDGEGVLRKIVDFLGLNAGPVANIDTTTIHNSYAAPRGRWARRLAGSRISRVLGQTVVPRSLASFIFERVLVKSAPKPPLDPRARHLLCSIYEPEVAELEKVLGRSLPELRRSW